MFQRQYVGDEQWKKVSKKLVVERLGDWYIDVPAVLEDMKRGMPYRTPFALYRWIEDTGTEPKEIEQA